MLKYYPATQGNKNGAAAVTGHDVLVGGNWMLDFTAYFAQRTLLYLVFYIIIIKPDTGLTQNTVEHKVTVRIFKHFCKGSAPGGA